MDLRLPPTVSIDGQVIREIREQKKLTQLYVAKVVGVTTDTISRWENNRYPSIKRDNALLLAEALEVPVECLLKREPQDTPQGDSPSVVEAAVPRQRWPWVLLVVCALVLAVVFVLQQRGKVTPTVVAHRLLPTHAAPGSTIPVRVVLDAGLVERGFILREHFPVGWKLIEANPPASSLDNINGTARWIIKPGEGKMRIVYLVRVGDDADLDTTVRFSGEVVLKGEGDDGEALVGGDGVVSVRPVLWPDEDANGIVDDAEILAASDVYEDMKGVHLNWDFLEKVWDAGGYRWIPKKHSFELAKRADSKAAQP